MATITDARIPYISYFNGVFGPWCDSNGNLYVVAEDANNTTDIAVFKSANGGSSWTRQDTASQPAPSNGSWRNLTCRLDGTTLHVVAITDVYAGAMGNFQDVNYYTFHTSDASSGADTWQISETIDTTETSSFSNNYFVGIVVRSDGDVVVTYTGGKSAMGNVYHAVYYARRESGTWTTTIEVSQSGITGWGPDHCAIVLAGSDRTHFCWNEDDTTTTSAFSVRDLSSGNTLSTIVEHSTLQNEGASSLLWYTYSSTNYVLVVHANKLEVIRWSEDGSNHLQEDESTFTAFTNFTAFKPAISSGGSIYLAGSLYDGSSAYNPGFVTSESGASADWSTPEAFSSDTITAGDTCLGANFYTRGGGERIGMVFGTGTADLKFFEYQVGVQSISVGSASATETAQTIAVNTPDITPVNPVTTNETAQTITPVLGEVTVAVGTASVSEDAQIVGQPGAAPQVAYPDGDTTTNGWTSTPLWSKLDDNSDADYITSPLDDQWSACELTMGALNDPRTPAAHVLRVRARRTGSSHASASLSFNIKQPGPITTFTFSFDLTTSFQTFEVPLLDFDHQGGGYSEKLQGNYGNISFTMAVTGDFGQSVQADVAWVEIEVPSTNVEAQAPSFTNCELPATGNPAPVKIGSKTYMLAHYPPNDSLWIFSATNPSNGYNPSEWTPERLAYWAKGASSTFAPGAITITGGSLITDGSSLYTCFYGTNQQGANPLDIYAGVVEWDTFAPIDWSRGTQQLGFGDPTTGYGADNVYNFFLTTKSFVDVGLSVPYDFTNSDEGAGLSEYNLEMDGASLQNFNFVTIDQTDGPAAMAKGTSDRVHVFFGAGGNGNNVNLRTYRTNESLSAESSSIAGGNRDLRSNGAVDGSGLVVFPTRVPTSGGVYAFVFTSADSPTPSEEQVSTRDADKASYNHTVAAVADTSQVWVLWVDAAADGIYYSERLGTDSWGTEVAAISGSTGRDRLGVKLISTGIVGLLTGKNTNASIEYYELDVGNKSLIVGAASVTETAQTIGTGEVNFDTDQAIEEDEAFDVVFVTPLNANADISMDLDVGAGLEKGSVTPITGKGVPRAGPHRPKVYRTIRKELRK